MNSCQISLAALLSLGRLCLNTQKYGLLSQSVEIILFLPVFLQGPTSRSLQKSKKTENKTAKFLRHETKEGWQRWREVGEYLSAYHRRL